MTFIFRPPKPRLSAIGDFGRQRVGQSAARRRPIRPRDLPAPAHPRGFCSKTGPRNAYSARSSLLLRIGVVRSFKLRWPRIRCRLQFHDHPRRQLTLVGIAYAGMQAGRQMANTTGKPAVRFRAVGKRSGLSASGALPISCQTEAPLLLARCGKSCRKLQDHR